MPRTDKIITAISGDPSFGDGDPVEVSRFDFAGDLGVETGQKLPPKARLLHTQTLIPAVRPTARLWS